jgi:hypothetical protein
MSQTRNKKYLLLKTLWTSFHAEVAGQTEEIPVHERLQLIDAFFAAMSARLGNPPLDVHAQTSPLASDMQKIAEYVV